MTSLAELRSIEEQRILAERAARQADDDARVRAQADAERARREAEEARIAAERAAVLAIEEARVAAEREARLRVEAAEAAERARHQAALDEARLAQEMEIARELAKRTKPRWMIAVTLGAVLVAGGLAWFAIDRMRHSDEQERLAQQARVDADAAKARAAELDRQVAILDEQSRDNTAKLGKAMDELIKAEGAAALAESRRKLEALNKEQAAIEHNRFLLEQKRLHDERVTPVQIKQECLDGVIGKKGC